MEFFPHVNKERFEVTLLSFDAFLFLAEDQLFFLSPVSAPHHIPPLPRKAQKVDDLYSFYQFVC